MIDIKELKAGDLLLLKKDKSFVYKYLKDKVGEIVANMIIGASQNEYLHVEMYLGEGQVLSATVNGVHIHRYSTDTIIENFDIYEPKFNINKKELEKQVKLKHNKRYDFMGLFLNIGVEIANKLGFEFEPPYETEFMVICSELVARVYEDMGDINFHKNTEFITPQGLVDSGMFTKK